ncbi:hypothetical protein V5N11_003197 [Cardamine amara subsp. amara]|uniref:Integrase catalytic domain-containing protein n=1 Tax=Cardamine amara subsp. amara TaxID=228776 RepID=A0ABD0Z0Y9_CARAN
MDNMTRRVLRPRVVLTTGTAPYPFMRWAMEIVGPLPPSQKKIYLLIVTDYFTKWVEAKAYKLITEDDMTKFIWMYIICRYGMLYEIITDNGSNLTSTRVEGFCNKWRIKLYKSIPW